MITTMPFGVHQNKPLMDVPSDYLAWLLRNARLSTGLRCAVAAELARRGLAAPEPPPVRPIVPDCKRCGAAGFTAAWQEDRRGRRRIRGECQVCGGFLVFLPTLQPWIRMADRRASQTPVLDVLTWADELGLVLLSDGASVRFRWEDWRRVPADLQALVRQCSHQLARLLGKTRRPAGSETA